MPGTKKDRRIVEAGHKTAQTAEDGANGHDEGNELLKPGEHQPASDFDMPAIPEEFLMDVDAQSSKILE